jgi:hypothetical protein
MHRQPSHNRLLTCQALPLGRLFRELDRRSRPCGLQGAFARLPALSNHRHPHGQTGFRLPKRRHPIRTPPSLTSYQHITMQSILHTKSPVPNLTSIHSTPIRGRYGDSRYPGNCSGILIKDLLLFFRPNSVLDPMSGSGTCKDVCDELRIDCCCGDIREDFDATDFNSYPRAQFDFVWLHPPYWRMKKYSDDPRDLSQAATISDFHTAMRKVLRNCRAVLAPGGKIAVLMGDYYDSIDSRMAPCVQASKNAAMKEGLWPACTDIIRLQHGNSSSKKNYDISFIPGLHDTCTVYKKA